MAVGRRKIAPWTARLAVLFVFAANMQCAIAFLLSPDSYAAGFELAGVPGRVAIQGIAVAFLMWNATYPLVILDPMKYRTLFAVVLVQQLVGLVGETAILLQIGGGHAQLTESILRFVRFDGLGLLVMAAAFVALRLSLRKGEGGGTGQAPAGRGRQG